MVIRFKFSLLSPGLLAAVWSDVCVFFCRLNPFRRVLDAERKDVTADGVSFKEY